jgi:hypothetical protein
VTPISPRTVRVLVALLLALFGARVVIHSVGISATFDEPHHLAAGYTYLRQQDYRLNPEHPPLSKKLAALPLLALEPLPETLNLSDPAHYPGDGSRSWQRIKDLWRDSVQDYRKEWYLGHELVFGVRDETMERLSVHATMEIDPLERIERHEFLNDADRLIFWGRLPLLVFGLLVAVLVFFWARDLWGPAAGLFALALCTFDPNFVAHTTLITSDVAAAALILGTVYGLWRYRNHGGWRNACLMFVCFSLAFTVKFSAILLVPIIALLMTFSGYHLWRQEQRLRVRGLVGLFVLCGVGSILVLWGVYGFRYAAVADGDGGSMPVDRMLEEVVRQETKWNPEVADREYLGLFDRAVSFANRHRVLPEAYLQGLAIYQLLGRVRPSFLNGEYSLRGFRTYFFWTFLLKTPLVTLLAIAGGLAMVAWRCRREDLLYLLFPAGLYFVLAAASYMHIGNRHILPVYPFLFVLSGGLMPLLMKRWPDHRRTIVTVAIALVAVSSTVVFSPPWRPVWIGGRPLEFFNELAGGPGNGYRHLVDSNLDWGQGLEDLAGWLEGRGIEEPINLCYFGTADPRFYQIRHVRVPCDYLFSPPLGPDDPHHPTIVPGYLAISATHLQGERDTQRLRELRWAALERAKLVDRVGNSIFIYRLE